MTLNPDGTYAQNPSVSLPKPTFFYTTRYEHGWALEAEWFLGTVGDPVKISMMLHPTEGLQVLRITGLMPGQAMQMEESCDWEDLQSWLTEQAVAARP